MAAIVNDLLLNSPLEILYVIKLLWGIQVLLLDMASCALRRVLEVFAYF